MLDVLISFFLSYVKMFMEKFSQTNS